MVTNTQLDLDAMCKAAMERINGWINRRAELEAQITEQRFTVAKQRMHWRHDDLVCLFNARFRHARKQLLRAHYPTNPSGQRFARGGFVPRDSAHYPTNPGERK